MSVVFSKKKEKRSRSPPRDSSSSSFVKNVTSRVLSLPEAVTKWFSSPSRSSNSNGSVKTTDATDSSTEDESPESPVSPQPPPKRMRFTSPGSFTHYTSPELTCITSNIEHHEDTCSPYDPTPFRRGTNFVSTPLRADVSNRTEIDSTMLKSTSHTVSTVTHSVASKRKSLFDSPSRAEDSKKACAKTSSNTLQDPTKPYFKPSLLGSPFYPGRTMYGGASSAYINRPNIKQNKTAVVNESSPSDNSISQSTRRIMDILENYSSPLNDAKRIPQYTLSPRNHSLSSSMNRSGSSPNKSLSYKTQELHVPSIASILKLKQKSRLMDTTSNARQIMASHSSTSNVPYPSTPVNNHRDQTDSESSNKSVTKVKSRLSRPTRGGAKNAEIEMPEPVSLPNAVLQLDQTNLPKFTLGVSTSSSTSKPTFTEVKTKITENTFCKPDIVTSSQAPYKFSTPVRISSEAPESKMETTLPKFTFGSPDKSIDKIQSLKSSEVSCVVGQQNEPEKKVTSKDWQCPDCWVFNKTDVQNCVCCGGKKPADNKDAPKCSTCKLANSAPNKDKCTNCEKNMVTVSETPTSKQSESSKWKCEDCWVNNNDSDVKCVCCGANKKIKPAAEKGTEKSTSENQSESSKWKCEDCWVNNNESDVKCVCCGASKTMKPAAAKVAAPIATSGNSEWKCDDCWIKNKGNVDKCAACGASRTGASPQQPTSFFNKPTDNVMKDIIKSQKDKWECPACLVSNDADKAKCICCESERAGSVKESDIKSFNFGMKANTTFKFGIPNTQETPAAKVETVTTNDTKKEESETNNNVVQKVPSFTFGLPSKVSQDQPDAAKKTEKQDDTPKTNFTFGVPKTSASAVVPSVFGIPAKPSEETKKTTEEDKEKPQEVPQINFLAPKSTEASKPMTNTFTSATLTVPAPSGLKEKPKMTSIFNSTVEKKEEKSQTTSLFNSVEKKDGSSPFTLQPAATVSAAPSALPTPAQTVASVPAPAATPATLNAPATTTPAPAPTFTFGTTPAPAAFKPPTNLFSTPATTIASTVTTFGAALSAPTNTSPFQKNLTTTSSLFSKSETPTTTSLFSKTETAPASTTPAPLFSFGGAAPTQNAQPEKPKFNFSFGANKSEAPALFQAPTDNKFSLAAPTENKFSLTSGSTNILGGNNILGGSGNTTLGGASQTGSGLQTNALQAPSGGLFGANAQEGNMWSTPKTNNASSNLFVSNTPTNAMQKPAAFTFGSSSSTPFNANATPSFGSTAQSTPNVFGMNQPASNPPSLFGSNTTGQTGGVVFGAPQSTPQFGSPSTGPTPTFGSPNPTIQNFEAQSHTPAQAPAFNFGGSAPQPSAVFGFGQPAQPPQPGGGGGFSFGAPAGVATPQVQFNMGSAPNTNTAGRRVRKAVRRTTPR